MSRAPRADDGWSAIEMPRLEDLWRWTGTLDRGRYALLGVLLAALKYNVDRGVLRALTGRHLRPWDYWAPGRMLDSELLASHATGLYVLVCASVPFVWTGVAVSARRLRSAGLPTALALLFFVPFVNVLLFLLLVVLPPRASADEPSPPRWLARVVPRGRQASAAFALLVSSCLTLAFVALGVAVLEDYGWGVFVGMPFFLGLSAALIHGYHEPRTLGECAAVALSSVTLLALLLVALAIEGAICIAMAAPIGLVLAELGALIGWSIQARRRRPDDAISVHLSMIAALPALLGLEHLAAPEPTLFEVATTIEIDAPPERVWPEVVGLIPEPDEWYFVRGIAYPIRAEIEGTGVGAVRRCVFSTGAFVEPIEVWDEPRVLAFSVREQPPALHEWSPWAGVLPAHVSDYLVSERGEFRLERRDDGGTHLVGTTWYAHRIFPEAYWRVASDWILHRIHGRVLEYVRARAEASERAAALDAGRRLEHEPPAGSPSGR